MNRPKPPQRSLHCPCGRARVRARGLCAVCYTLRRQDEAYFGGLREKVLARDGYSCRGCGASGRGKRSIVVHHRRPGKSKLDWMISLCPTCHGRIHNTQVVLSAMPPPLLTLWREFHPDGHEQRCLDFEDRSPAPESVGLFADRAGK